MYIYIYRAGPGPGPGPCRAVPARIFSTAAHFNTPSPSQTIFSINVLFA